MNSKERKEMNVFPKQIDEAIIERFGAEVRPRSYFDFFDTGDYKTEFKAKGVLKYKIDEFIAGYIAGNVELRERMDRVNIKIKTTHEG